MGSRAVWLWIFLAMLGVTGVLGVAALLLPNNPYKDEALATAGLLTVYSLGGLAAAAAIGRRRSLFAAWSSVVVLSASLAAWLTLVWLNGLFGWLTMETIAKIAGTMSTLGVALLHWALVSMPTFAWTFSRAARTGTRTTAVLGAAVFIGLIWRIDPLMGDLYWRSLGVLLILASLGTIATPILWRIEHLARQQGEDHTIGKTVPVHLRCPRCGVEQELAANRKGRCKGCGLKMSVQVNEPRCQCGYLLYGLPEAVCPECGRQIPDEHRWPNPDPAQP